jgi:hypothetical protein
MGTVALIRPSPAGLPSMNSDRCPLGQSPTVVGELHPDLVGPGRNLAVPST